MKSKKSVVKSEKQVAKKREPLKIGRFLDIGTCHVTPADVKLLSSDDRGVITYPYEFGFWIWIPSEKEDSEALLKDLKHLGYSENFQKIFVAAMKAKCRYIMLDQDGEDYEQFEECEW